MQEYLAEEEKYLTTSRFHDEEGPRRSAPHDEGRPDEEWNLRGVKYSTMRLKYSCVTAVHFFATE